jgi:hypothetical protein
VVLSVIPWCAWPLPILTALTSGPIDVGAPVSLCSVSVPSQTDKRGVVTQLAGDAQSPRGNVPWCGAIWYGTGEMSLKRNKNSGSSIDSDNVMLAFPKAVRGVRNETSGEKHLLILFKKYGLVEQRTLRID